MVIQSKLDSLRPHTESLQMNSLCILHTCTLTLQNQSMSDADKTTCTLDSKQIPLKTTNPTNANIFWGPNTKHN